MEKYNSSCPLPVDVSSLNLTEYEFDHQHLTDKSDELWETLAKSAIYSIVFVMAVIGNVVVLCVVFCNQHMRTTVNYYLVNLALADLAIALFCMWTHLVKHLSYPNFILGPFMCRIDAFIHMTALTSSVLTMTAISCDRFFAVMCPLRARFTKQRASGVISAIWMTSVASSMPFIFLRQYSEIKWKNYTQPHCGDVWAAQTYYDVTNGVCIVDYPIKRLYYIFFTMTLFFLPITVMSITYFLLVRKLWLSPPPGEYHNNGVSIQSRAKKKVIKLVLTVLIVFIACWTPLQVLTLYGVFGHHTQNQGQLPLWFSDFEFAAYFIAYSNSVANPIIYCGFNNNFRRGMTAILFGVCLHRHKAAASSIRSTKVTNCPASDRHPTQHDVIELSAYQKPKAADV
ncbi:hypothetical protein CHUAL_007753 [Chamberlinius hualienensis]